jgi:hypothetical protein
MRHHVKLLLRRAGASTVTDRRQFLAGLAAVPLSAMAGDQTDTAASLASGLEVVPCPPPTPGSVTSPDGSIAGTPLTDLVDAYSQVAGVDWQQQLYSVLTNRPDACAHYRQNQVVAYEKWLVVVQIAYRSDLTPAPFATGTHQVGVGDTDAEGTLRTVAATYQPHGSSCSEGVSGQRPAARSPTPPSPTPWSRAATTSSSDAAGCRAASPRRCACCAPRARPREPVWRSSGDRLGRQPWALRQLHGPGRRQLAGLHDSPTTGRVHRAADPDVRDVDYALLLKCSAVLPGMAPGRPRK